MTECIGKKIHSLGVYCRQTSTIAINEVIIIAKASPASNVGAPH
jgi:hypothetical protein